MNTIIIILLIVDISIHLINNSNNQLKLKKMDKTIDEVLASVTKNATVGQSVVTLLTGIKKQLDEALSGVKLPPAVQAKLNTILEISEADTQKIEEAIVANTPNEETPPTEPPVEE